MVTPDTIENMCNAVRNAKILSETRRGAATVANFGDLLISLEEDLQNHIVAAPDMPRHYRHLTEHCLHQRIRMLAPGFTLPPPQQPLFINVEYQRINELCHIWKAQISAPKAIKILFGQMRINHVFQGAIAVLSQREGALTGRNVTTVTPDDLGYGLGCRVTVARHNGDYIALSNRTYAAHVIAGVKPLRLIFRDADPAEINRLNEVEGVGGVAVFNFATGVIRPAGTPNPRILPADWIPIEDTNVPAQVINSCVIPQNWTYA